MWWSPDAEYRFHHYIMNYTKLRAGRQQATFNCDVTNPIKVIMARCQHQLVHQHKPKRPKMINRKLNHFYYFCLAWSYQNLVLHSICTESLATLHRLTLTHLKAGGCWSLKLFDLPQCRSGSAITNRWRLTTSQTSARPQRRCSQPLPLFADWTAQKIGCRKPANIPQTQT